MAFPKYYQKSQMSYYTFYKLQLKVIDLENDQLLLNHLFFYNIPTIIDSIQLLLKITKTLIDLLFGSFSNSTYLGF